MRKGVATLPPWQRWPRVGAGWPGYNLESDQADGLVAWWSCFAFEPGGWGILRDVLGTYHLAAQNTPTITGSELGPVALFDDAADQHLRVDSAPVSAAPFSVAVWFARDDADNAGALLSMHPDWSLGWYLRCRGDGKLWWAFPGGSAETTTAEDNTGLHHGVAIEYASDSRAVFLDGGGKGTDSTSVTPTPTITTLGAVAHSGGASYEFSGWIAEARVYNRALSDAEVWALYDPATRWDLYRTPRRVWYTGLEVVTGAVSMSGAGSLSGVLTAYISGPAVWGHDTSVVETSVRDFSGNWSGTGSVENAGDSERIALDSGEIMTGEITYLGSNDVYFLPNNYQSGDTVIVRYRTAATVAGVEAAAWNLYTWGSIITSSGFVQLRVESTL